MSRVQGFTARFADRWGVSRLDLALLAMLLLADAAIVAIHVGAKILSEVSDVAFPEALSLAADFGPGSVWNYGKLLLTAVILMALWRGMGAWLYFWFGLIFLVLLIDDAFEVHDRLGLWADRAIRESAVGIDALGEPLVFAGLFVIVACLALLGFRGAARGDRDAGVVLAGAVLLLAVFGAGVDQLRSLYRMFDGALREIFSGGMLILEEGGELVSMSLALWFALVLWRGAVRRTGRRDSAGATDDPPTTGGSAPRP